MSDRGVRYACREYVAPLQAANMKISMSRTGNPFDNAHMESFFKTIKYEEVHRSNYETLRLSMTSLSDFPELHQAERELTTPRPGDIAGARKKRWS